MKLSRIRHGYLTSMWEFDKIAIFSKSYCPYCAKAKSLLKSYPGVKEAEVKILEYVSPSILEVDSLSYNLAGSTIWAQKVPTSKLTLLKKRSRGLFLIFSSVSFKSSCLDHHPPVKIQISSTLEVSLVGTT